MLWCIAYLFTQCNVIFGLRELAALHLQPADDSDVVAVPQRALPNGHAVWQRIGIGQLNLLDNLTGVRIVLEERVPIGVGDPEVPALPADSMGPITCGVEPFFDDPGLRIHTEDHTRRRHGHPELAVPHFLAVSACSQSAAAEQLAGLESSDFAGIGV